jgi:hypothetical protein
MLGWGSLAHAQQATPVSAAGDSLSATGEEVKPTTGGAGPTEMTADTTVVRRVHSSKDRMMYYMSLGIGSSINYLPDEFKDNYDPAFGIRVGTGISRHSLRLGVNFSYNFFLSNGPTTLYPDDLNILTIFAELKYVPGTKTVRPYIMASGGYYRQWIVNAEYTENVLGYGAGAGIELTIDKVRHLFLEGRYIQGQTRETQNKANTESIPLTLGVVWVF